MKPASREASVGVGPHELIEGAKDRDANTSSEPLPGP